MPNSATANAKAELTSPFGSITLFDESFHLATLASTHSGATLAASKRQYTLPGTTYAAPITFDAATGVLKINGTPDSDVVTLENGTATCM